MGQCAAAQPPGQPMAVPAGEPVMPPRRKTARELCSPRSEELHLLRDEELQSLEQIVEAWSDGQLPGPEALERFQRQVLRGRSHISHGLSSSAEAAAQAGAEGAVSGAQVGMAGGAALGKFLGESLISAVEIAHRGDRAALAANVAARSATVAFSLLGGLAGGVAAGVGCAFSVGVTAAAQSRQTFRFVDRVLKRCSQAEAWELAARQLGLQGLPAWEQVEEEFVNNCQAILESTSSSRDCQEPGDPQTVLHKGPSNTEQVWLRLVHVCLSYELLRCLDAPPERLELPAEALGDQLRLDQEFLALRVQELAAAFGRAAGTSKQTGLSKDEIAKRCPLVTLETAVDDQCPVCLEQFERLVQVRRLPCGHLMHCECCEAWLETAPTCPTCRGSVRGAVS
eukprot:TRINITY_DN107504_c0_g1_i1.p1 TRINITY_DN107504_c0_g1~~TRINITY_DN107504_c0_g1_i1.p1  ORF type:complete len:397 (+),score=78.46 TRINITY_DN107504_c0_g1_i1:91-1281(+)